MDTLLVPGQAAQAGDVQAASDAGTPEEQLMTSVPVVPPIAAPETKSNVTSENEQQKNKRISDKVWQENKEAAKEGEELKEAAKTELGVDNPVDLAKVAEEVRQLREENRRKDWEIEHAIVRNEKYAEEWKKVNTEKRYEQLTYDERWSLINREKGVSRKELSESDRLLESSVPVASKTVSPNSPVDQETMEIGRMMGYTEEDYRKAGVLR